MRLLRLDLGGQSSSLNLHPFLTVMQRRGVDDRQPVINAARSLANGDGSGVYGLVETNMGLIEVAGTPPAELICPVTTENIVIDSDEAAGGSAPAPALQAELDQLQRPRQHRSGRRRDDSGRPRPRCGRPPSASPQLSGGQHRGADGRPCGRQPGQRRSCALLRFGATADTDRIGCGHGGFARTVANL